MNKKFLLLLLTAAPLFAVSQEKDFIQDVYHFIENPALLEINQEPGHAFLVPFRTVDGALKKPAEQSEFFLSLNGKWKFNLADSPELAPADFFKETFNDKAWPEIGVPGNWEMQGFGDPQFRNVAQPFRADPPKIPHYDNPTGSYRKTFLIPPGWKGKQVFLRIEAATSASFVWINGKQAGFNKGANEPAEYNITPFLRPGKNLIAVRVTKYSDGTYLEDQDFWRLAGIFRDVRLVARENVFLRNCFVTGDLDPDYRNGILRGEAEITNYGMNDASDYQLRVRLFDQNFREVIPPSLYPVPFLPKRKTAVVPFKAMVDNPAKWSAEYPNLYITAFELVDRNGKTCESVSVKTGFRKIEVNHQVLLLNGKPLKLNGVNSHMQHPDLGHAMNRETIIKDFTLMKQFNINCVRTSHYPPVMDYLELADAFGIYIVDETGDEAHATEFLSEKPEWRAAYVERANKMVLRDRNHPCVIFWSAGNESGTGENICAVIAEGKKLDPTRLWMYGGNTDDVQWKNEVPCEDIIGPRYPTLYELKTRIAMVPESQDPRPSFMDEYVAATGNGAGGLDEYWNIIWNYPRCAGGAIWDWMSPGIREKVRLIEDGSPNKIQCAIKGRAQLVPGISGQAVRLNGHDQWIDVYRHQALDLKGNQLTIAFLVKPGKWNGDGHFLTKGSWQYGIVQSEPDSLVFYLTTKGKNVLKVPIPQPWEEKWHQIAGVYTGSEMLLYVDGVLAGRKACSGSIANKPFPLNLGRDAEIDGQEYPGPTNNTTLDEVGIFCQALKEEELSHISDRKKDALLWLDFEKEIQAGDYFSTGIGGRTYGLVWPDRTPQPELWQVKKSAQPVSVRLIDPDVPRFEVWNRYLFTPLSELETRWELWEDGTQFAKGILPLNVPPQTRDTFSLPLTKPGLTPGCEYRIHIRFLLKNDKVWAKVGHEVAWDETELPWHVPQEAPAAITGKMKIDVDSGSIRVLGNTFSCTFNRKTGVLESIVYEGKEFLRSGFELNVWRAPLANEKDAWTIWKAHLTDTKPGMGIDAANAWRSLGLDHLRSSLEKISWETNEDGSITVTVLSHAEGNDVTTAFDNTFAWTIYVNGLIRLRHQVIPQGIMPQWIQRLGIQSVVSDFLYKISWYGRGPFENYPDRKSGAKIGIYSCTTEDMEEPYLIPQDHGLRCDVRWLNLESPDGYGLRIQGKNLFNFNVYPYSTEDLTRAAYPYQLTRQDGFTLNIDYATSGVGCTAVSVLNQYRVVPAPAGFELELIPYRKNQ